MSLYLVTGGAGFIGSHLTEELIRRGEQVRVVDSLITGHRKNLAHLSGIDFLEGDLADLAIAKRAVEGVDYVLHQAAIPSVPRSVEDPITSNRANIDSTLNVLVAARDARVKRVVYAGSSSAYGNTPTLPKHEDMPTNPLSPYALQKLVGEQYMQMFTALYGLETVTIRYFNVFGPRQDPSSPYSGVISVFAKALLENKAPTIYGDGEQTRDFTYVANVVDGVLRAVKAPGASGQVVNVATGSSISLNQLFASMREPDRQPGRRGVRPAAEWRRQGFAGRHHARPHAAGIRAAGVVRGRAEEDDRLVPDERLILVNPLQIARHHAEGAPVAANLPRRIDPQHQPFPAGGRARGRRDGIAQRMPLVIAEHPLVDHLAAQLDRQRLRLVRQWSAPSIPRPAHREAGAGTPAVCSI